MTVCNPRELGHVPVSLHIFFRYSSEGRLESLAIFITVIRKTGDVIELRKTTGAPVNFRCKKPGLHLAERKCIPKTS